MSTTNLGLHASSNPVVRVAARFAVSIFSFLQRQRMSLFPAASVLLITVLCSAWSDRADAQTTTVPSFRASSSINGSGTLNFPAGSVEADWLVMSAITTTAINTPPGWKLERTYLWDFHYSYVFTRQRGVDTSVALSLVNGGAVIAAYQNAGGIGTVGDYAQSTVTANTLTLTGITPQSASSIIVGVTNDRDTVIPTPPAGHTSRVGFVMTYFGFNIADRPYGSTQPTSTATWSQAATARGVGVMLEVLPVTSQTGPIVPHYRSHATLNINSTTSMALPAGDASDWLLMSVTSNTAIPTPDGWTLHRNLYWEGFYAWQHTSLFTRQRGTATSVTLSVAHGGAIITAFRNVGGIGAVGEWGQSTAAAATILAPAITGSSAPPTPIHPQSLIAGVAVDRDVSAPGMAQAGWQNHHNVNHTYFGNNLTSRTAGNVTSVGPITWNQTAGYIGIASLIELRPIVPASISGTINPINILPQTNSSLTLTISNPNQRQLNQASFSLVLPSPLQLSGSAATGSCVTLAANNVGSTPVISAGVSSLAFNVSAVPVGGCTITLNVTGNTPSSGTVTPTISGTTTQQTPYVGPVGTSNGLNILAQADPATVQLSAQPAWLAIGSTGTITWQITSPSGIALSNLSFSHNLSPLTLTSTTLTGTCTTVSAGNVTATPSLSIGGSTLNLNLAQLPAGGCSVTASVTGNTMGSHLQQSSGVTAAGTGSGGTAGTGAPSNSIAVTITEADNGLYYVQTDHLNTPRAITRPSDNAVIWRHDNVDPFGANLPNENPSGLGMLEYNLGFPGQYRDKETGTMYNYFRDYDPSTGRYVQSDPIGLAGGVNTYAYVGGNPLSLIDPTGEFGVVGGLGSAGFELFVQLSLNGFELQCVDWGDVAAAGFIGFFVPRPLQELGRIRKGFGASITYQTQLVNARSASSAAKTRSRLSRANGEILGGVGNTAYSVGAKTAVKDIMPPSGNCKKEDPCGEKQ
ncbi:MAG: RHS repeat-associated core domain-containing protein [Betaproteobacteria bacterium]|jgi:RHS repeat-associated protein|nr:RHS repeat-associated core domain-containing protein [Betaproteobacteria bacterium]